MPLWEGEIHLQTPWRREVLRAWLPESQLPVLSGLLTGATSAPCGLSREKCDIHGFICRHGKHVGLCEDCGWRCKCGILVELCTIHTSDDESEYDSDKAPKPPDPYFIYD